MKRIIERWYHKPGRHCASTAIRDAMRFWGFDISEAFCFGLGQGIGAFYLNHPGFSPSKWLMTRCAELERRYFAAVGIPFEWKQAPNAQKAWQDTKAIIDSGTPALLHTDLYYLDYYNTKTHFNGHAVLIWGYDEEKGISYLSDTNYEGLQEVTLESLAKARNSSYLPGPIHFNWFPIHKPGWLRDLKSAAVNAIHANAAELAGSSIPNLGLKALTALTEDLPKWKDAKDWSWSARFTYQAIEKRGTGGSAFRSMYAEFLKEVEEMNSEIKPLGLSELMAEIARHWSRLAAEMKAISESESGPEFEKANEIAQTLFNMESQYCSRVLSNIKPAER